MWACGVGLKSTCEIDSLMAGLQKAVENDFYGKEELKRKLLKIGL